MLAASSCFCLHSALAAHPRSRPRPITQGVKSKQATYITVRFVLGTLVASGSGVSRGVLSRSGSAIELTRDHKPNDDREKARILAMGEKIEWDHYCKVHRVRNLSLSRAIGDRFAKPAVSGEVEIKCFPVYDDKDEFILLASDGLWDVMSSQEVVSYVHKRLNAPPKEEAGKMVGFCSHQSVLVELLFLRVHRFYEHIQ